MSGDGAEYASTPHPAVDPPGGGEGDGLGEGVGDGLGEGRWVGPGDGLGCRGERVGRWFGVRGGVPVACVPPEPPGGAASGDDGEPPLVLWW